MTEYVILHCGACGQTWPLDFMPEGCTCEDWNGHPDDDLLFIEANDAEAATKIAAAGYPSVTDHTEP